MVAQIAEHPPPRRRHDGRDQRVQDDRDALVVRVPRIAERVTEDRGGERHDDGAEQDGEVDPQQADVHPADQTEEPVVVEPDDADADERDEERHVRRPLAGEPRHEFAGPVVRIVEVEDEQRDSRWRRRRR
ncbi:hypothetical protein PV341_25505 [Streptomyces sp. PA03-1a]|nr:hypothetical protein [Streptomyces sp. PA03-1a]